MITKRISKRQPKFCVDCGTPLKSFYATRCRPCFYAHVWRDTREKAPIEICPDCGKQLPYRSPTVNKVYGKPHRCHSCAAKRSWEQGYYRNFPRGGLSKNWRGGKTVKQGYVLINKPEHHRANKEGYVYEHILIWEIFTGQELPKGWVVHHLNGIRHDNRPRNLAGLPNRKHYLVLEVKAKRIQELEALLNNQQQLL